jgi:hypothetical protein
MSVDNQRVMKMEGRQMVDYATRLSGRALAAAGGCRAGAWLVQGAGVVQAGPGGLGIIEAGRAAGWRLAGRAAAAGGAMVRRLAVGLDRRAVGLGGSGDGWHVWAGGQMFSVAGARKAGGGPARAGGPLE